MDVVKSGTRPSGPANADYFVGDVVMEQVHNCPAPARANIARVTFQPGARTNWHTHPLGQTLYVLSGVGRVQKQGEPVHEILPGDVVWIPPGEKHWHGAAPDTEMCHIACQERGGEDDMSAHWLEPVSDADYTVAPA